MLSVPGFDAATGQVALLDATAARFGDRAAVDAGDTWAALMARSAHALATETIALLGHGYGLRVAVVVGKGNNGGDGWGAAEVLRRRGAQVRVVAPDGLDTPASAEADAHRQAWLRGRGWASGDAADVDLVLNWAEVGIDAVLGTGSLGAPRDVVIDVIKAFRDAHGRGLPIVACDLPSGISADDGKVGDGTVDAEAVIANLTVTFGGLKRGLVLHPGVAHAGRVVVAGLGPRYQPLPVRWHALTAAGALDPPAPLDAEKRMRGVALAVAGNLGTAGAAALCGRGLVVGHAGLVTIATPGIVLPTVAGLVPAAMTRPLPLEDPGGAAMRQLSDASTFDVVVAGPGLGTGPGVRAVVDHLLASADRLVLDADALNAFREDPDALADHAGQLVVTPHVRELARLARRPDAERHRTEVAVGLARRLRATVVAKGPATVVAASDGRVWVTPVGGPALATGGTGDVLAGLIGASIATAADVALATARAVWHHGFAGDHLAQTRGGRLTSEALVDHFPEAMAALIACARVTPTYPFGG